MPVTVYAVPTEGPPAGTAVAYVQPLASSSYLQLLPAAPTRDPRDETQEIFELVYEVVAGAKAERSSTMYSHLKCAGYRMTQKKMNEWIRDFFADEIAAGSVKETRPHHHHWKGFARRVVE